MHTRAEEWDARYRRLRMRVLNHEHAPQVEREAQGMEVELLEVDGIAFQGAIHLGFRVAAKRLVDEKREGVRDQEHDAHDRANHEPAPWNCPQLLEPRVVMGRGRHSSW